MYKLILKSEAEKFVKTHKIEGARFIKAFDEMRNDISTVSKYDIVRFKHTKYNDIFRLRIGKYRAIFRVVNNELVILVIKIDSRGEVYK